MTMRHFAFACLAVLTALLPLSATPATAVGLEELLYKVGTLKPTDSVLKVAVGDTAPDFTLPSTAGGPITLSSFRGKKNVVLSFVPAAWTPVCSGQWPGYHLARDLFDANDAIILGISVDNAPTLNAWTKEMGAVWFPVLSDFWPHGAVASTYGILRSDGVSERALFLIDKAGVIRYIDVHDINARPELGKLIQALKALR
ncbi:MAG: peroxiredoxin [Desulfovibrionaceae bacterium]